MWMHSDPSKMSTQTTTPEEEDADDDEMGVAETYADYMPTKRKYLFNFLLELLIFKMCNKISE